MDRKIFAICIFVFSFFPVLLSAQSSVKGNTVGGTTGIIVTPTARIGWEYSDFGIDFGYSFLHNGQTDHVPAVNFSFLRKAEVGLAADINDDSTWNLLFHGKFQFFREGGSSVAMGVEGDFADMGSNSELFMTPYLVASYSGNFFTWPAVTSMMFGWNMLELGEITSNFSFSMGFELALAPQVFKNYIFWISDFSNYSYSSRSLISASHRGAFNTGIRIDPLKKGKFKLVLDLIGTDLLDSERGFMASATFGIGF
jgi:hypothetical protein